MEEWIIVSKYVKSSVYTFKLFCRRFEKHIVKYDSYKRIVYFKNRSFRFISENEYHTKTHGFRGNIISDGCLEKILLKQDIYEDGTYIEGDDYETFSNELSELRCGPS